MSLMLENISVLAGPVKTSSSSGSMTSTCFFLDMLAVDMVRRETLQGMVRQTNTGNKDYPNILENKPIGNFDQYHCVGS